MFLLLINMVEGLQLQSVFEAFLFNTVYFKSQMCSFVVCFFDFFGTHLKSEVCSREGARNHISATRPTVESRSESWGKQDAA